MATPFNHVYVIGRAIDKGSTIIRYTCQPCSIARTDKVKENNNCYIPSQTSRNSISSNISVSRSVMSIVARKSGNYDEIE